MGQHCHWTCFLFTLVPIVPTDWISSNTSVFCWCLSTFGYQSVGCLADCVFDWGYCFCIAFRWTVNLADLLHQSSISASETRPIWFRKPNGEPLYHTSTSTFFLVTHCSSSQIHVSSVCYMTRAGFTEHLLKVFGPCLCLSQQPVPERLRIRVSRISMSDYEALHYDKDKLRQACKERHPH